MVSPELSYKAIIALLLFKLLNVKIRRISYSIVEKNNFYRKHYEQFILNFFQELTSLIGEKMSN